MDLTESSVCMAATGHMLNGRRQGMTGTNLLADYIEKNAKVGCVVDQPLFPKRRLQKLRDFWKALTKPPRCDLYFADEVINFQAAWLLKKLGRVKTVVYIPGDYWLAEKHWLGRRMHKFALKHADKVLTLPNLCPPVKEENFKPRFSSNIAYVGGMTPRMGIGIAVKAMKFLPSYQLLIIGGDGAAKIDGNIVYWGFLDDRNVDSVLRSCQLAVAPYVSEGDGLTEGLDSAKVRLYAWHGLPTLVSTDAKETLKLVERFGAGVGFEPTPEALVKILECFNESYFRALQGCRELAKAFDSEKYFGELFEKL